MGSLGLDIGSGKQIVPFPGLGMSIALGTGSVPMALAMVTINELSKDFSAMSHDTRRFKERSIPIKMIEATNFKHLSIHQKYF